MPTLQVEKGKSRGKQCSFSPNDTVTVGREASNTLSVVDAMVSRRHLKIDHNGKHFLLTDLGSANGTRHNGSVIQSALLEYGDSIVIGETMLSFVEESHDFDVGECTGRVLAGYEIGERIGRGGMGTVYRARQVRLEREVAFKVLAKELANDEVFIRKFVTEARAAGQLNHPNIIQVYDVGNEDGIYFFSMEYVSVGSVTDLLATHGKLDVPLTLQIVHDTAEGLKFAEERKFIHRDIKPSNLMVGEGNVTKIGDLGIAQRAVDGEPVIQRDGISGSPHYMAPEQALGKKIDHRVDLYSLGCSWYEMLTGETPFQGRSPQAILMQHVENEPPPLKEKAPWVGEDVAEVVAKLLQKDPDERYQHAAELLADVEVLREAYPPARPASAAPAPEPGGNPASRKLLAFAALIAAIGLLSFVVATQILDWAAQRRQHAEEAARLGEQIEDALASRSEGEVLALVQQARDDFADQPVLAVAESAAVAIERWRAERAAAEAVERERQQAVARLTGLLDAGRLEEAGTALEEAGARYPGDAELAAAGERLAELVAARAEERAAERLLQEAEEALARLLNQVAIDRDGGFRARAIERLQGYPERFAETRCYAAVQDEIEAIEKDAIAAFGRLARDVERATGRGEFAQAGRLLDRLTRDDHLDLPELLDRVDELRAALAVAERAAEQEALEARRAEEQRQLDEAIDAELVRTWQFDQVARDIARNAAPTLPGLVEERDFLVAHYEGLAAFKEQLIDAFESHDELRRTVFRLQSMDYRPSGADREGVVFSSVEVDGLQTRKRYDDFDPEELAELLEPLIEDSALLGAEARGNWALFQVWLGGDIDRIRAEIDRIELSALSPALARRLREIR